MNPERHCPDCGLTLPAKSEGAGCPHCLLRLAIGDESTPAFPGGLRSRFFGDYELLSELARGGMGVIYRARQISLNRVVALKMIQPGHLSSPEAWLRFQTEIAASAQLNHPNIVPLYDSGTVDGAHFFTMRLLEGGSLATCSGARSKPEGCVAARPGLRTSREQQSGVAAMMVKIARAVHHAHQRGVLHRDLKPSNILLDEQGEPHVADFGLAKMLARESAATLTDSILGSPNYMAPEVADGRGKDVTVETDVYGLGAVLYEALTGTPPFQARTPVETIRKVLDEEPVALRRLKPGLDADLETICLKCLRKNPSARYRSAEELAADLERWMQDRPILARPVGPLGVAARWARRHPALATVSTLLALLLLIVAVGASVAAVHIRRAEQTAVMRLRESLLNQARVLRTSKAAGARNESRQLLRQAAELGGGPDFQDRVRDEMLATLCLPQVEFSPLPQVQAEGAGRVLMDPGMKQLARISGSHELTIAPVARPAQARRCGVTSAGAQLEAFSPNGRFLAVRHATAVEIHDVEEGKLVLTADSRTHAFCFASHAPWLALEESDCEVSLRELPSGRELRRLKLTRDVPGLRGRGFTALDMSPDGKLIAAGRAADNGIELADLETGRAKWRVTQESPALAFAWHPARGRICAATADGRLLGLRLSDGAVMSSLEAPGGAQSLAADGNSGLIAGACRDRRVRIWDLNSLRLVYETECEGRSLAFDEGALRLGTVLRGDRVGWLTFAQSPEFTETVVGTTMRNIEVCAFSGKGDLIAIGHPTRIALVNGNGRGARGGFAIGEIPVLAMDPRGEFMLASDITGVTAWPLPGAATESLSARDSRLVIPGARWRALDFSSDGARVWAANAASNGVYGYTRDFSRIETTLGPLEFADAVAASPDGRWVAAGSSLLLNARVWNTATGAEVLTLHAGRRHRISFSGDGRWFAAHGDVFDLRRVGTWEPAPPLPYAGPRPPLGAAAFSPDGRILAVVEEHENVRLLDLATWKSVGLLRSPAAGSINALAFSPDGARLAAACTRGRLRLWDLAAIRRELALLNFHWELPWATHEARTTRGQFSP